MILARQNIHFLDQALDLLDALDDHLYCACDAHGHSCVGAHMRHVLDCYSCFLRGLDDGRIDYDARERNPELEADWRVGQSAVRRIRADLEGLDEAERRREVRVRVDAAAWGDVDPWTRSTVGRELQFLLSHTVHHFALIAMTLRSLGFEPGRGFGVAPSTLEHQGAPAGSPALSASHGA